MLKQKRLSCNTDGRIFEVGLACVRIERFKIREMEPDRKSDFPKGCPLASTPIRHDQSIAPDVKSSTVSTRKKCVNYTSMHVSLLLVNH